jgi:hypothetical protein
MVVMIINRVNRRKEPLDAIKSIHFFHKVMKSGAKANSMFRKSTFGKSRAKLKSKL